MNVPKMISLEEFRRRKAEGGGDEHVGAMKRTNFAHLEGYPDLYEQMIYVEALLVDGTARQLDIQALVTMGKVLEKMVQEWVGKAGMNDERVLSYLPDDKRERFNNHPNTYHRIMALEKSGAIPKTSAEHLHEIRIDGAKAMQGARGFRDAPQSEVRRTAEHLYALLYEESYRFVYEPISADAKWNVRMGSNLQTRGSAMKKNHTGNMMRKTTRIAGILATASVVLCTSGTALLLRGCAGKGSDSELSRGAQQESSAGGVVSASGQTDTAESAKAYKKAYEYSCGTDIDYEQLKTMYEEAASLGSVRALYQLGRLHEGGKLGKRDGETARAYFEQAIEAGEAAGYTGLGVLSYEGVGTERDYAEALSYFRQAAEQGDAAGLGYLGRFYEAGRGSLERDDAEAIRYYEEAAAAPEGEGWNAELGDIYFYGYGVERDFEKAAAYYQAAADAGSSAGYYGLANCAYYGYGLPRDKAATIDYLEQALAHNPVNSSAAEGLADFYFRGDGVAQDTEKALAILEKGVEYQNSSIMNSLACIYRDGDYVQRDINYAISLYEQAAKEGNPFGDVYIAYMYAQENGVEQDLEKAKQMIFAAYENAPDDGEELVTNLSSWYLSYAEEEGAKERGFTLLKEYCERHPYYPSALISLGTCYRDGTGTAKDTAKAMECYEEAVQHGSIDAYGYIGWMFAEGNGVAQDMAKARELWEEALSIDPDHCLMLGNFGESYAREEDYETALSYFEQTKALGYNDYLLSIAGMLGRLGRMEDAVDASRYAAEHITGYNYARACLNLGYALEAESAKQKEREAIVWFKEAAYALPSDTDAMLEYAWRKYSGEGATQDYDESFRFFQKAADRGNASAMYWTGASYMYGLGVKVDNAKAIEYLEKAKENDAPQGENIDELLRQLR